ncbi:uncharacterized protein LOC133531937 [Cydia pomonella]|uniref:uncharacterized protein LOC133531937 n=1 Tax=Cydia pomonella TaxID=82600 RepID=UPI002ADD7C19|nr:uncharacterized protein LOC133531937 [Cydia pomonella]
MKPINISNVLLTHFMVCRCHILGVFYFLEEFIKMTYRFILIVCLQVLCQNAHSQAINPAIEPTEVTITEAIIENPLDNQPSSTEAPTTVNQEYGPCGLPIHLCQCNRRSKVTITEGYSDVVQQSDAAQSICPRCGLSVELCKCGNQPEVAEETANQPNKLCPNCGRPVELCICGAPSVVALETTEDNQSNNPQSLCPKCGRPMALCICGVPIEVTSETAIFNQPNNPSLCPNCGRPIELCICGNQTPVIEGISPVIEGTSFVVEGTSPMVEVISAEGDSRVIICPKCGRSVELCVCSKDTSATQMCPHCGHPIELCMCGAHHHHH